jgi:hypothetical protein
MSISTRPNSDYCAGTGIVFIDSLYQNQFLIATGESGMSYPVTACINRWASVIAEIEEGYNKWPMELEEALSAVRAPVDDLLMDTRLNAFAEHRIFIKAIGQLDTRFMDLTFEASVHPEDFHWYERRILLKAGPHYIDFLPENLKSKVALVR